MKITNRQLRHIITEAIEFINSDSGQAWSFDANSRTPETLAKELLRKLKIQPIRTDIDARGNTHHKISGVDWNRAEAEVQGKTSRRGDQKEIDSKLAVYASVIRSFEELIDTAQRASFDLADHPDKDTLEYQRGVVEDLIGDTDPTKIRQLLDVFDITEDDLQSYLMDHMADVKPR